VRTRGKEASLPEDREASAELSLRRVRVKVRDWCERFHETSSLSPQLAAPVCARATSDGKQEGTGRKKTSERVRGGNLEAVSIIPVAPVSRRVIYARIGDSGFADPALSLSSAERIRDGRRRSPRAAASIEGSRKGSGHPHPALGRTCRRRASA